MGKSNALQSCPAWKAALLDGLPEDEREFLRGSQICMHDMLSLDVTGGP